MNTQTKPGAVTPGPFNQKPHGVITGGVFKQYKNGTAQSQVAMFCVDDECETPEHSRSVLTSVACDALNVHATTAKTPSELAAEVEVLTAQLAEVREQREYYRGVPAGAEVERLAKDRDALLGALREGRRAIGNHDAPGDCYATGPLTGDAIRDLVECPACSFIAAHDAAIHQCEGAGA